VPLVGMGTYDDKYVDGTMKAAVKSAIELGYRSFDCAWGYDNEHEVGEAIEEEVAKGVVVRKDLFIVSKLHSLHHDPDRVREACQMSLKSLRTPYLDLYLMHWPMSYTYHPREAFPPKAWIGGQLNGKSIASNVLYTETWKAMEKLVDEGLVRRIGLSNFNRGQIEQVLLVARIKPVVLEVECHLFLQQQKLIPYARQHGMAVIAYCTIFRAKPELLEHPTVLSVAAKHKKTAVQVCNRFLTQQGIVVIPKSNNPARLKENKDFFDFTLDESDMTALKALDKDKRIVMATDDLTNPFYPFKDEY